MTEFASRWMSPAAPPEKTPKTTNRVTDKTIKTGSVGFDGASKGQIGRFSPPGPFAPLDAVIAKSGAGRHPLGEIEARLSRLTATAARPGATPLDRQLLRDWTAIRDAKLAGRG